MSIQYIYIIIDDGHPLCGTQFKTSSSCGKSSEWDNRCNIFHKWSGAVFAQLKLPQDKGDQHKIDLDDFNRIFLLSLLKDSFMDVLAQIDHLAGDKSVSLSLKIENHQRQKMFDALKNQMKSKVNAEALLEEQKNQGKQANQATSVP